MIRCRIMDGFSRRVVAVTGDNALKVTLSGGLQGSSVGKSPEELTAIKQYRGYLLNGASDDLNVDGSATPVEFVVSSDVERVKWITGARVLLNGVDLELNTNDFRRFGAAAVAPGLTNGIEFWIEQGGAITDLFIDPIQTIGDFMNYADEFTNFVNAITAQSDFLSFDFDFDQPIVLPPSVTDRMVMRISDDLTAIELFKVMVRGYQELIP